MNRNATLRKFSYDPMKRFATSFHVAFFRNAVKTAADRCIRSFQHTNPAIDFRYFQLVRGYRPNFYRS